MRFLGLPCRCRIGRVGPERYPELVARGALGELVTSRILARFLKDTSTSEERRLASKKCLEELKQEALP